LKEILKFLKTTSKDHPIERGVYCIMGGNYGGEFFVFLKKRDDEFVFISLPDKVIRHVPEKSFNGGIKNRLVEFVEKLPKKIFKEVELLTNSINTSDGFCNSETNNKSNKRPTS
jgi:hypothetical protein